MAKTISFDLKTTIIVFSLLFSGAAHAASCGSLAAVQGTVDVLRSQVKTGDEANRFIVSGKNFLSLECDDIVVTRGQSVAKIILANGKISMGPDSRVEIAGVSGPQDKPSVNLVNLAYGKVRAIIQKKAKEAAPDVKGPQSSFQIHTHTAVAGVRGTDFFVGFDPNSVGTEQATLSGTVEVENKETHQKVLVSGGQQVAVEAKSESDMTKPKSKQLIVVPIQESIKHDLRIASAVAKDDKDFAEKDAVKVLGNPDSWTIEKEAIPSKYKDLKNEF